jgi:N-acetylmuramoyl-L-alanine amidase
MSAWIEKFIDVDPHTRSGKKLTGVKKLVVHYTANNGGTAMNHYNYFNNLKDRYASAHIFVDKKEALCIIPLNEVAFHAGDVQKRNADGTPYRGVKELLPSANYLSIGVEMCVEKDGTFHADTINRTEDVFVELCKEFKLDPLRDIVRHFDVTAKNCPAPWVKDEQKFVDFKKRVDIKLNPPKKEEPKKETPKPVEKPKPVEPKLQLTYTRILKEGMSGKDVGKLQEALNKLGFKCGKVDNEFGSKTKAALKSFQKKHLPHEVDSMAGKHVIAKINSLLK